MKLVKKILMLYVMTAMICVPASAEDVTIDTLLLMFGSANLTVNVDGGLSNALSGTYTPYDVVTVQAPNVAGKNFNYWTNGEGKIISYSAALTLTIYSNTVLNAVYGTEAVTAQPAAEFLAVTRSGNQIMFNVMATAQSDITEYGIRYSTTKNSIDGLKGDDGVTAEKAGSSAANWLFNVSASDDTYYAVAYVTSGGETYYSDVKTVIPSELDDGVLTIAMLMDLLMGESLDNVSEKVMTNLRESLCTISYDANGGSGAMTPQGFLKNTASTLNANTFTRNGCTFTGWNTQADGTGTSYQDGASVTLTENMTLYAQWRPIQYAISYDLNGGTLSTSNPVSYDVESADIKLNNPTMTGYTFAGWTGTGLTEASTDVTIPTGSAGNREYTANWRANTYTVRFVAGGGTGSMSDQTFTYDVEQALSSNAFTRNGYTFTSWLNSDSQTTYTNGQSVKNLTSADNGVITLTAQWTANTYRISFDLDGGELGDGQTNPTSYDIESGQFSPQAPTKTGYDFEGWLLSGDIGGTASRDLTIPTGSTGNREYIAQWTVHVYTLSYALNGGTVSPDNPANYTIESDDFTLTNPTKTGYTFDGWTGTSVDVAESKDVTISSGSTGDREYSANWTVDIYVLSYDLDGGTVSPDNPTSYTIESGDIKLTRPTKPGYEFTGWSFDAEISLDVTIPSGSAGNRDYTATWEIVTYTISYDLEGGALSQLNSTSYDVTTPTFTLTNPTRTGYNFAGWTGTGIAGISTDVTIPTGSTGNREYTATWTAIAYTISYTLNGESMSGNPENYTIESEAITLNNPTKNGYQFDGWTGTDIAGTAETVTIPAGSTGARSYTANFTPITYTITYNLDGGTNNTDNPASYTIESQTITLNAPTKTGCDFAGWVSGDVAVTEIPSGSTGNITLTALWGDTAPVMSSAAYSLSAYKGSFASLAINAAGLNLKWSLDGELPSGLSFSGEGNSASISGTPELGTSGTYSVRVIAANDGGSASADVLITVASNFARSGDVEAGDPKTVTTESGANTTTTTTAFKNGAGNIILTADIAITTEADEFTAYVGQDFTTSVNVDVTLNVLDPDYNEYSYSMEMIDLPDWLSAEGEMTSSGKLESSYHHEFTLSGTPLTSRDAEKVTFVANITIAGEEPALDAYGSKEVMITVNAEKISGDVSPDVGPVPTPAVSPDIEPHPENPAQSSDIDPQPENPAQSPDVTPQPQIEPVVIEDGKITINDNPASGDTARNISDIISNMTDEEKQSITKLEINSDVQSVEWLNELENLEELTIGENASVEELDISGNTSIKELDTSGANVKSLNVSGCENLVRLDCSSCGLEQINLDGCRSLNVLNISNNSLMVFDAGSLPGLQELICDSQVVYVQSIGQIFALGEYFRASYFMENPSASENVKNLKAFDTFGNEIAADFDSETGTASFSEAPLKVTYDYDTGFNGVMMDVTVYSAASEEPVTSGNVGSSGGGCNSIFGTLTISAGLILILRKRRI